jgi:hypothetical protein
MIIPIRPRSSRQTSPNGLMTEVLPYLRIDKDRHGNERIFVRRHGRNIRLREASDTAAFQREYANALQQIATADRTKKAAEAKRPVLASIKPRTFGWIAARYFGSGEFAGLDPVSRRRIRTIIESCCQHFLTSRAGLLCMEPSSTAQENMADRYCSRLLAAPFLSILASRNDTSKVSRCEIARCLC